MFFNVVVDVGIGVFENIDLLGIDCIDIVIFVKIFELDIFILFDWD